MADVSVERLVDQYVGADLIILDELGFTPLNRVVADHILRIVSERYERGSMIVTSNKPFEQWAEMFVDPILANAALDRLIHHAHVVPIAGESYRTKDRRPPPTLGGKAPRPAKPPSCVGGDSLTAAGPFSITARNPELVMRPIVFANCSVNHRLPSAPLAMS